MKYRPCKKLESENDKEKYIGKIFKSRNYGEFKVLGVYNKVMRSTKRYICQFINTGGIAISQGSKIHDDAIIKDPQAFRICEVCGKTEDCGRIIFNKKFNMKVCVKHAHHLERHGKILDRTTRDLNDIVECAELNCAKILVYNKENELKGYGIIDIEDVSKCSHHKWGISTSGYLFNQKDGIWLHRHIYDYNGDLEVEHINTIKTDCRKFNLRLATHEQNSYNVGLRNNNTSGCTGVYWNKRNENWYSKITFNGVSMSLGTFIDKEEAVKARKDAEVKYFGEFRYSGDENE